MHTRVWLYRHSLRTPVELPFGTRSGTRHAGLYVGRVQFIRHVGDTKRRLFSTDRTQLRLLCRRCLRTQQTGFFLWTGARLQVRFRGMARHDRCIVRHERNRSDGYDQCRQVGRTDRFRYSDLHSDQRDLTICVDYRRSLRDCPKAADIRFRVHTHRFR